MIQMIGSSFVTLPHLIIEIRPHSEYRWESLKQMMLRISLGNNMGTPSIMLISALRMLQQGGLLCSNI
ncbi:hypothetical protein [Prevotella sp. TCVGH]|uniref:hypothetical protein n=1 Tax=Prevotella sp. TCVGH TaxID=2182433 RepID=UPI00201E6B7D|nr:hypothetical protein [Prevotella sp. TCVGH]